MTSDLTATILELPDTEALEAAQFYALELPLTVAETPKAVASEEILTAPQENLKELAQLSRLLLLSGVEDDRDSVARSINGAGKTQFILGGAEIVALAVLLVKAANLVVTKGKTSVKETETTETNSDGSTKVTHTTETKYGLTALPKVASLLAKLADGEP